MENEKIKLHIEADLDQFRTRGNMAGFSGGDLAKLNEFGNDLKNLKEFRDAKFPVLDRICTMEEQQKIADEYFEKYGTSGCGSNPTRFIETINSKTHIVYR